MSSSYVPETPPRSHRKHKRNASLPYATPKTPFSRHHDISADYKISSKTNLLKTPSHNKPFTVYQTPITPKSTSKKNKSDLIVTPPSASQYSALDAPQFNSRLLFPANPSRIGSGRSHTKQNLKAPSLTTLLTMAANSSEEGEEEEEEAESSDTSAAEPKTPRKQTFLEAISSPPRLPKKADNADFEMPVKPAKARNPFVSEDEPLKSGLVYVDKYGRKKIEKLSEEEAGLLQKTKRKLTFN